MYSVLLEIESYKRPMEALTNFDLLDLVSSVAVFPVGEAVGDHALHKVSPHAIATHHLSRLGATCGENAEQLHNGTSLDVLHPEENSQHFLGRGSCTLRHLQLGMRMENIFTSFRMHSRVLHFPTT